jgi:hypothetical protein
MFIAQERQERKEKNFSLSPNLAALPLCTSHLVSDSVIQNESLRSKVRGIKRTWDYFSPSCHPRTF